MSKSLAAVEEYRDPGVVASLLAMGDLPWIQRRDWLRAWLKSQPLDGITEEEIGAHFDGMPPGYWECLTETELRWGLEVVHRFFGAVAMPNASGTRPVVDWKHLLDRAGTRLMLCTWDRRGLLAKAAACLSAVNLSIRRANIYTRSDSVALDVFHVCDSDSGFPAASSKLEQMTFLLDGALSEPPRFASVWACSRHKFLAPAPRFSPQITFDNDSASAATLMHLRASDRLGLLYDVLQAIADGGCSVTQADIETADEVAHDVLHITDANGRKICEAARLEDLRRGIETAIGINN